MARRRAQASNSSADGSKVATYQHKQVKRKNNPPAAMAAEGTVPAVPKAQYYYSPRRPPSLRFDPSGKADKLPELIAEAGRRPLTSEEQRLLAEALRNHEPWLEWAEKLEQHRRGYFEVDPVALHIHERVSTQAILRVAARQDVQRSLFADPQQEYHEAVQFYRHDIDWTNRLILGDSLQVMSSLAYREGLAGKVQMIYIDPPYGIKFASNFQPEVGRRDVKDKEQDLTREPEMVKAYRDTWHLGIHSYLSYLRDRLIVARELLADTGSIFVQISDENLHRVRTLMDEVLGASNFCGLLAFKKTGWQASDLLASIYDFLLWYSRDAAKVKFRQMFTGKLSARGNTSQFGLAEWGSGEIRPIEPEDVLQLQSETRLLAHDNLSSQGVTETSSREYAFEGYLYSPPANAHWKTPPHGLNRLANAHRLMAIGNTLRQKRYLNDFPISPWSNIWDDTAISGFAEKKSYVVQTSPKVIERCLLMTTDPGDLVLDPTCGSGTTAYVAEQWGRRWITIDTSRVAVAIARQRLLTAKFDYYELRPINDADRERNPGGPWLSNGNGAITGPCTFKCKTVPHVTLKSIAQNKNLDPIFAKHEPILEERLAACNAALAKVSKEVRARLEGKLLRKQREEGKKAVTDADRRRWLLPPANREEARREDEQARRRGQKSRWVVDLNYAGWYQWEVPFDTDPDWPSELQEAVTAYRQAWRAKMDEVNACIAANAEQEELVDQPYVVPGVTRVSGPFTVEAVQPPELSLGENIDPYTGRPAAEGGFGGEPEELPEGFEQRTLRIVEPRPDLDVKNLDAYLDQMARLLRVDGVRFPDNKQMKFTRLERVNDPASGVHAEGRWTPEGREDTDPNGPATVGVVFGPQYGPVTAKMVEEVIRPAARLYEDLVIAGFSFDGPAQAVIDGKPHPKLRIHRAHIRPDVNPGMNGLLKEQPGSQLFTVFGQPRTKIEGPDREGNYRVIMEGVDIYDPVNNVVLPTDASKVAAWFIDGDYDGRTFCITQAFFPDRSAWDKLARALGSKGIIDESVFEQLSGTESLPFPAGTHKRVAVKVIDPRGNEVMAVHKLQ